MAVAIHRRPDGGMAELGLDELRVDPLGNQEGRKGMAEIVKSAPPEPCPAQGRQELPPNHVLRMERLTVFGTEHEVMGTDKVSHIVLTWGKWRRRILPGLKLWLSRKSV